MILIRLFAYCLTALMTLVLIWGLGWMWYAAGVVSAKPYDMTQNADAIVVLTGGDKRVNTGLDLLADGKGKLLFISGVNKKVKPEELIALWNGPREKVLARVALGYVADSTASNTSESEEWIRNNNIKSIRLVTANYHMARSHLMFHTAMPDLVIYKHPVVPEGFEPWREQFWPLTLGEYNKLLATWLRLDLLKKNPSLESQSDG